MNNPLRLAINGATGRMGRVLLVELESDARFELCAQAGSHSNWRKLPELDVLVDFSTPKGFQAALSHCVERGVALVSGSTGLDAVCQKALDIASQRIAVMHTANFSIGVAALEHLLAEAARLLPRWDLEILEAHHARKEDAPSGTALALGRAAAQARGQSLDELAVYARHGRPGPRVEGSIGFSSIRAGDIVGEHSAILASAGERIELVHRATDRSIFARGALQAAAWIAGRTPGRYTLADVLL